MHLIRLLSLSLPLIKLWFYHRIIKRPKFILKWSVFCLWISTSHCSIHSWLIIRIAIKCRVSSHRITKTCPATHLNCTASVILGWPLVWMMNDWCLHSIKFCVFDACGELMALTLDHCIFHSLTYDSTCQCQRNEKKNVITGRISRSRLEI